MEATIAMRKILSDFRHHPVTSHYEAIEIKSENEITLSIRQSANTYESDTLKLNIINPDNEDNIHVEAELSGDFIIYTEPRLIEGIKQIIKEEIEYESN
nr:MAG TPA: hypothetical protein [Bacteriophage sp.]